MITINILSFVQSIKYLAKINLTIIGNSRNIPIGGEKATFFRCIKLLFCPDDYNLKRKLNSLKKPNFYISTTSYI